MSRGFKTGNEYAQMFADYSATPKSVYSAIALSFAMRLCADNMDEAIKLVRQEWDILNVNRIVPQKPPRTKAGVS